MPESFHSNLRLVQHSPALLATLGSLQRGIEKESLRITRDASLAMTPHPASLGSALCHPRITTDYSEALLELITSVHQSVRGCLEELEAIHRFVYAALAQQDEMLWTSSMPCRLGNPDEIPIARYGSSNVAQMKYIYRVGLGHRYGRAMQSIAGIHYNFSLSDRFWTHYHAAQSNGCSLQEFKTNHYFGLIRNFRRHVPLLIYLFGASPALCRTFLQGRQHDLTSFDQHTLFREHATSLRMSDLGYQSSVQEGLSVSYNSLAEYTRSLLHAITQPIPAYEKIGLQDKNGEYQQLSTSLLQIENEFYSPIRPKRVAASGEAPLNALARGGVEYVEVRCLDINPFTPVGIDSETIHFLDLFLLFCLFEESPLILPEESARITHNLKEIVNRGRADDCTLLCSQGEIPFRQWAGKLLDSLKPLAITLDSLHSASAYQASLSAAAEKIHNPSLTPSAQILRIMRNESIPYAGFARHQSTLWAELFTTHRPSAAEVALFTELAADSIAQQQAIERASTTPFAEYLHNFYRQYPQSTGKP